MMKRKYLKPGIRVIRLRLNTFMAASPSSDTVNYGIDDLNNPGSESGVGSGTVDPEGGESRSWGRNMWDDM